MLFGTASYDESSNNYRAVTENTLGTNNFLLINTN